MKRYLSLLLSMTSQFVTTSLIVIVTVVVWNRLDGILHAILVGGIIVAVLSSLYDIFRALRSAREMRNYEIVGFYQSKEFLSIASGQLAECADYLDVVERADHLASTQFFIRRKKTIPV